MKTIIVDPFPRKMELIFKSSKLKLLKKKFNIINAPKENKLKFYKQNLKFKLALFLILFVLVGCILITGERSNGIKAVIGLMIFLFLNNNLKYHQ